MGFWQNLVESYDQNAEALKIIYPLSTTSISNNSGIIAIIVIDGDGKFIRFDKIQKKSEATKKSPGNPIINITIPASEESLKRTSTSILPYPVFEQYEYIKGIGEKTIEYINKFYAHCDPNGRYINKLNKGKEAEGRLKRWKDYSARIKKLETRAKKYDAYTAQLKDFAESTFATEPVKTIYKYVKERSIASDLSEMKLNDKTNIIFQVEILGNMQTKVWEDETLFNAWNQYYLAEKDMLSLDYITGTLQPIATFHPKKISNASANAKLVSANDKTNFTFRGKFTESSEAVSIGYQTTQKAHQFLRYLIKDRGCCCGEQAIFSFTIGSLEKLLPPPIEDNSIWGEFLQEPQAKTQIDIQIELNAETGVDYAESLRKSLGSFEYGQAQKQHPKTAVVALDAVSDKSGRLAITFYRELERNEYLEKIAEWHSGCKWHQKFWDEEKEKYVPFTGAPSVDKVIEAIHGKPRSGKDESYTKIKKAARERLLRCIFDGAFLPKDYVVAAVRRASNPLGIKKDGKFDRIAFEQVVSTACALVRKDYLQGDKEDYKLSIELDRTDRDYLYGRLLGAADKLEEYALYKKDNDRVVTAAIRHMQAFTQRPFRTWQTIHSCLNPYIQTVKGSFAFAEIEAVIDKFESGDFEKDVQLNGSFLLGYYHERAYIVSFVKAAGNKKK
ncbi:MAG: type I-C CRISPR-associated protein Cas8c/Csd1 [Desulfoprunum sp.]